MRSTNAISGGVFIALGLFVWFYSASFPSLDDEHPGPSLFPRLIAVGLVLCGLGLMVAGFRLQEQTNAEDAFSRAGARRLAAGLVLAALIPVLYAWVGLVPGVGLLCFGVAMMLDVTWWKALAVAAGGTLAVYLLFTQGLGVPLS